MDIYSEIYDRWLRIARILGLAIVLLREQMYQKFSPTNLLYK